MLLTITTTDHPATDIGYLLGQNPNRCQSFSIAFGQAHVFYPIAGEDQCAAALLLYIDPVALVRGRRASSGDLGLLAQYVNDRPYVASSFLSVAIASVSDMLPLLTIEAISPDKLVGNQGPVIGALVVTLPGRVWNLMAGNPSSLLPRGHPLLAVAPSGVDAHLDHIRELAEESVIAVASISQEFLRLARALLAPVVGAAMPWRNIFSTKRKPKISPAWISSSATPQHGGASGRAESCRITSYLAQPHRTFRTGLPHQRVESKRERL